MLHKPTWLSFDEPTRGLDQEAAAMLDNLLREVAAQGRTVVMTSHDLLRTPGLASRVDILSKGVIHVSLRGADLEPQKFPELYRSAVND